MYRYLKKEKKSLAESLAWLDKNIANQFLFLSSTHTHFTAHPETELTDVLLHDLQENMAFNAHKFSAGKLAETKLLRSEDRQLYINWHAGKVAHFPAADWPSFSATTHWLLKTALAGWRHWTAKWIHLFTSHNFHVPSVNVWAQETTVSGYEY